MKLTKKPLIDLFGISVLLIATLAILEAILMVFILAATY